MALALLLLSAVDVVAGGAPRVRVAPDDSEPARFASDLLRRHVVLITGVALPETGTAPPLRIESGPGPGYRIEALGEGLRVRGDVVRAAYDVLEGWGCRFDDQRPVVPRKEDLSLEPRAWRPERELWWESDSFDPAVPATGISVRGLAEYDPAQWAWVKRLGFPVRVASDTFDDFLAPAHFEKHPEWFALRGGRREPRGNFALTNADARAAYLAALGAWLDGHPEVARLGIWPEVTTVWCEESAAHGHAESYALLWREAAARFPSRRFEILATGLTLRPPEGRVPENVEVRLRAGSDASALQGIAGQDIEAIVRAWEVRGARVVLEVDAAPDSWCGMTWPCHDALRADARRFGAAALRGGTHAHARIWRDPAAPLEVDARLAALLRRAKHVRSWGHPRDAAELFVEEEDTLAFRIAAMERLHRTAMREGDDPELRRSAAADAFLGFLELVRSMPAETAAVYRRYRARDFRRMMEELLPQGVESEVGPAKVRDTFDRIEIETDTLRLSIDRRTATIVSVSRHLADGWSDDLAGGRGRYFTVIPSGMRETRDEGDVELASPRPGVLRVSIRGHGYHSQLELSSASGRVRQVATVPVPVGDVAVACRWSGPVYDRWICPAYATEGRFQADAGPIRFPMPGGTLLYCRGGETGPGLAARLPDGGVLSMTSGEERSLIAAGRGHAITVDWTLFVEPGELGK